MKAHFRKAKAYILKFDMPEAVKACDEGLKHEADCELLKTLKEQILKEIELDVVEYSTEEDSDIDIALNLESEQQIGK